MNWHFLSAGISISVLAFAASALASEADDSRAFIKGCQALHARLLARSNAPETFYETYCLGYLSGFREEAQLEGSGHYCIPSNIPLSTLVGVYVEWADSNRSEWSKPVFATVGRAMAVNYPCRSS